MSRSTARNVVASNASTVKQTDPEPVIAIRSSSVSYERIRDTVDGLVHILGFCVYASVFMWHFSARASTLPGAAGYGWFFKFLTFWGWTLQMVQFLVVSLSLLTPKERSWYSPLARLADDLSCLAFCAATTVTVQFYVLQLITGGLVERTSDRPPWLGVTVHLANSVFAWLDIAVSSKRSFSKRSKLMGIAFCFCYCLWILACRHMNSKFPYPFLNALPFPLGFVGIMFATMIVFYIVNVLGALKAGIWQCFHTSFTGQEQNAVKKAA